MNTKQNLRYKTRKERLSEKERLDSLEWFPIPGYEGKYFINKEGQVFNKHKRRIIKGNSTGSRGYHCLNLSINGIAKNVLTHVVMARLFIPNPENKLQVNHKNGIKSDYRLENLEWVTCSENHKHAFRMGLTKSGGKHHEAKTVLDTQTGIYYDCVREAAEAKGIIYTTLRSQLQGAVSNRSGLSYI